MIDIKDVSPVTIGTWALGGWMWGGLQEEKASIAAINAGLDNGINAIDTAPIYGQGDSELLVGKALKRVKREQVFLMTKFGMRWDSTNGVLAMQSEDNKGRPIDVYKNAQPASIRYEVEQSLLRMQTDYIDLYQIHWPDVSTPIEESFEEVARLIKEGKIRYAGVCNYSVEQLAQARTVCPIATNQVPYSMLNRGIEEELVPYCVQNNVGILAYSPMERGLLTGKITPKTVFEKTDHRSTHRLFQPEMIQNVNLFLEELAPMAEKKSATVGQLVLAWTRQQAGVLSALAGVRTVEQAIANAWSQKVTLEHEELLYIDKHLQQYFLK